MSTIHIRDFMGKRVHMTGIGGSSMSGLALMLLQNGYQVSGSDRDGGYAVEKLRQAGIPVVLRHHPSNVEGSALVIYTAAIAADNPELVRARELNIPTLERGEMLGQLMEGYEKAVAVAGTHGKTSTCGMLAQALVEADLNPTVQIGGQLDAMGGNARAGGQDIFLAEACEFNGSFLYMKPTLGVVLNIEEDHLDYYQDIQDIENAFYKFMSALPTDGLALGNGDDPRVRTLLDKLHCKTLTFGFSEENHWYPGALTYDGQGRGTFTAMYQGAPQCTVSLQVPGNFNVLHALTAIAAAHALGADMEKVAKALSRFTGVHRRFEKTGEVDGVTLYHDYGHNPAEMTTALEMAKMQPHNRLWAVMQPHTYSRVKRLFDDYLTCTRMADITLVTDIYGAREVDPGDIRTEMLIEGMRESGVHAIHTPSFDDTEAYLRKNWQPGDLVITMGCGNINLLNDQIHAHGDTIS